MWRYRLKVILLALGVVLGYGSALHHHGHCHPHFMQHLHGENCPWSLGDGDAPANAKSPEPAKPLH
jgi:hypothetical protein